jgi:hypothetical protein
MTDLRKNELVTNQHVLGDHGVHKVNAMVLMYWSSVKIFSGSSFHNGGDNVISSLYKMASTLWSI